MSTFRKSYSNPSDAGDGAGGPSTDPTLAAASRAAKGRRRLRRRALDADARRANSGLFALPEIPEIEVDQYDLDILLPGEDGRPARPRVLCVVEASTRAILRVTLVTEG